MKSRHLLFMVIGSACVLSAVTLSAQVRTAALSGTAAGGGSVAAPAAFAGDNQADPGYPLYKEGYALVLEEKWKEARKKFHELIASHPRSEYADDAQYWSAYSLKHIDRKAAIEAYEKFIEAHAQSRYVDDAMADLNDLKNTAPAIAPHGSMTVVTPRPPRSPGSVTSAVPMRSFDRHMRLQLHQLNRIGISRAFALPRTPMADDETMDPGTRLKMEALYALGETTEDDKSYTTLREVALDMKQPQPLREAAMDALTNFSKHDVMGVFVEIATRDTNSDIQGFAIDFIGEHGSDKNQRVAVLADLYRKLPRSRTDQRQTIVYTIADVGNDKAVEFLKSVALGDEDYDLRRDAVYYLGNIGGEKARAALYEILKGR